MAEEHIPIVNTADRIVGSSSFSTVHRQGLLHREAYTYLINKRKEVLLQQRTDSGLWDHSSAGHFPETESYAEGARREFAEELGIQLPLSAFKEIAYERIDSIKPQKKNRRFVKVFVVRKDIPLHEFKIEKKELIAVRYFGCSELRVLLSQEHVLTNSAQYLIKKYLLKMLS
ncbi:MAG: NUDIX domain-containing protein [Nanoarchaeota archaeon]